MIPVDRDSRYCSRFNQIYCKRKSKSTSTSRGSLSLILLSGASFTSSRALRNLLPRPIVVGITVKTCIFLSAQASHANANASLSRLDGMFMVIVLAMLWEDLTHPHKLVILQ